MILLFQLESVATLSNFPKCSLVKELLFLNLYIVFIQSFECLVFESMDVQARLRDRHIAVSAITCTLISSLFTISSNNEKALSSKHNLIISPHVYCFVSAKNPIINYYLQRCQATQLIKEISRENTVLFLRSALFSLGFIPFR